LHPVVGVGLRLRPFIDGFDAAGGAISGHPVTAVVFSVEL